MKTAISVPDDVFAAAEAAARRAGLSRSELFVKGVKLYLEMHGDQGVTERLDAVYAEAESKLDPALQRMQFVAVSSRDEW